MNNTLKQSILILLFLATAILPKAWSQSFPPVAEMRGAWVSTVVNIDWPSASGLPSDRQQIEFDSMLDVLKSLGINAVFVQVRPTGDAIYPNDFAPWSKYLTGKQGAPPVPMYDPLEYMIKSAHSRKMEFHAWLNPYRATFDLDTASLSPSHKMKLVSQSQWSKWFFRYGKRYYFNPANPEVINHLTNIVGDIVTRYDVDGIHFDDYFYPYKEENAVLSDYSDFSNDSRGLTNIEDWRRDNVNKLISSVSKRIRATKNYVRFGISPFGVWRNKSKDPMGSDTKALAAYDDLFADVLLWLRNDWIDYVAPQLYWSIGFPAADYQKLVDWWGKNSYGKHVYIGHAVYKVGNSANDPNWNSRDQIGKQIGLTRSSNNVKGSIFFSAKQLLKNPLSVADTLQQAYYATNALLPAMPYKAASLPVTPSICRAKGTRSTIKIGWNACTLKTAEEAPYYFAIYRFIGKELGDFTDPRNRIGMTNYNPENWTFEDKYVAPGEYYTYVVTAFNRLNVQSFSSEPYIVKKTKKRALKKSYFGWFLPW